LSYVVSTSMAALCHGQDYPGSIPVTICSASAGRAHEASFPEREAFLGSRTALSAGHRCIGGRDQHHLPARPLAAIEKFPLGRADRGVSGLTRHRGPGQEQRLEVLDGDHLMVIHNPLGPCPGGVCVLARGFLLQLRSVPPGALVPVRLRLAALPAPPGHFSLRLCQFSGAASPVAPVRQVVGRIGGSSCGSDAPVDADPSVRPGRGRGVAADDERGVPVAEAVPVNTDARRGGRQVTGPYHGNRSALGQAQPAVADREPAHGVLQRGQGDLAPLFRRPAAALDLERVVQSQHVCAEHLLLSDLGAAPQPPVLRSRSSQQLRQLTQRRLAAAPLLMDRLVPQPAAPAPLLQQRALGLHAGAQAVGVAHCFRHATIKQHRPDPATDFAGNFS